MRYRLDSLGKVLEAEKRLCETPAFVSMRIRVCVDVL